MRLAGWGTGGRRASATSRALRFRFTVALTFVGALDERRHSELEKRFGCPVGQFLEERGEFFRYILDCIDEAERLMVR